MKRNLLLLLLCAATALMAGTDGSLDIRIKSSVVSADGMGTTADRVDSSLLSTFLSGTSWGAVDTVYHASRSLGSGSSEVLGLVGSLTNSIGETVTLATVKGLVIQSQTGTQTLTLASGLWCGSLATATIHPYGAFALVGSYPVSATGTADRIAVTNSSTGTTTYLIWIVGTK